MASGRLQLASVGVQDEFLTGDPQITYFLKRFKRHTKFALETIDNGFNSTPRFGSSIRCIVPRKGDLIRNIYVRIELSELTYSEEPYNVGYTDSIGHALIDYADLIIGGQTIQRITGEFIEIYCFYLKIYIMDCFVATCLSVTGVAAYPISVATPQLAVPAPPFFSTAFTVDVAIRERRSLKGH